MTELEHVGKYNIIINNTASVHGAFTDLLHEHVDVSLSCVQDVSVRVFQAFHCDFHRLSVDVDPPRRSTSQERPERRRRGKKS